MICEATVGPCISPISPLYLIYISPISPLTSVICEATVGPPLATTSSSAMWRAIEGPMRAMSSRSKDL